VATTQRPLVPLEESEFRRNVFDFARLALALVVVVSHSYPLYYGGQLQAVTSWGDFSYGSYLYAFPIQQMLIAVGRPWIPFWLFMLSCIVASLAAGIISWYLVERSFLRPNRRSHPVTEKPHATVVAVDASVASGG